jgi:hypothetical protein
MMEKEEQQPEIKVNDRRKFNLDGSLREGVVIEPENPKEEANAAPPAAESASKVSTPETDFSDLPQGIDDDAEFDETDIPGAEDPASFVNFLSTLATNAAASLGAMPHPATGQRTVDLETGKYWLDILGMLTEKTKGNLHPQEARLLQGILGDLRMQYVQLVRASEEKLKQQAAQKFSANDILGKK